MVYIIYPDVDLWSYVLDGITDEVVTRPLNQYCTKIQLLARKAFPCLPCAPFLFIGKKIRRELSMLDSKDVVLICDYTSLNLLSAIRNCIPSNVKSYVWLWNPIKGRFRERFVQNVGRIKSMGFIIATFDPKDAIDYDLVLKSQFYRMIQDKQTFDNVFDFYFLGFAKDRESEINQIKLMLRDFKLNFHVAHSVDETISYDENISNILKSKCLVEVVQQDQKGLTLRPLEAIAFRKKLLTNNKSIREADFYKDSNIFIIGERDIEDLSDFLSIPYDSSGIDINEYDVTAWINSFR